MFVTGSDQGMSYSITQNEYIHEDGNRSIGCYENGCVNKGMLHLFGLVRAVISTLLPSPIGQELNQTSSTVGDTYSS